MNEYFIDTGEYLEHHGVKGQRWGVRKKRKTSGGKRFSGSKTNSVSSASAAIQSLRNKRNAQKIARFKAKEAKAKEQLKVTTAKNKAKAAEANLKAAKKNKATTVNSEELQKMTVDEQKQAILKQRSGKALYKNADLFTTDELAAATRRLQLEKTLREIDPKQKSKGELFLEKTKSVNDSMKTVTNAIDTGVSMYNTINKYFGDGKTLEEKLRGSANNKKKEDEKKKD